MEPKHIITALLIIFKVYIIVNFIIKYRKMLKRISILEKENEELKNQENNIHKKIA